MDVDGDAEETANPVADVAEELEADDEDSDDEDDRYEDPFDVAMVPMADMLNGRFATETVCRVCPSMFPSFSRNSLSRHACSMKTSMF